jgi:glutamine amidotransferase
MCRLYGFISNEATKVDCSLVYSQNALMMQSRIDERGVGHTDGWGIATYQEGIPHIRKETTAAFEDGLFSSTAEKIYSNAILAHVRKATVGVVSIANTHPFLCGQWTFAHNGTVTGFEEVGQILERETDSDLQRQRQGDTDSEQYFLWLLSNMRAAGINSLDAARSREITDFVSGSVSRLAGLCQHACPDKTPKLNFVMTDGVALLGCRWNNSLHIIRRRGIYDCEICGIPHIHHSQTVNHRAIAIASEPVSHEAWEPVANETVVLATVS